MNEGAGTTVGNSAGSSNGTTVGSPDWIAGYDFLPDTSAPAAPQGLAASADDGAVGLSWSANGEPDLAGYDLYRSTSTPVATSGTPLNGSDLIRATSYADSGLSNGTSYHYALVAVDGANNRSPASGEASATPAPASHALQFNGSSQYVTMGQAASLGAPQFTLETWFKRTGAGVGTSTGTGGIA